MLTNPLCCDRKDFKAFPDKILKHIPVQFQSFDIALKEGQCMCYKEVITQISPLSELPVFNPGSKHNPLGKQSILSANAAVGSYFLKGEKSTRVLLVKGLCSKFRMQHPGQGDSLRYRCRSWNLPRAFRQPLRLG